MRDVGERQHKPRRVRRRWVVGVASVAAGTVLATVVFSVVAAVRTAGASLESCQAQQGTGADAVVVTPTATGTPSPAATPTRRARRRSGQSGRRRGRARTEAAVTSQLAADDSGLPKAVDPEGKPIAGAVQLVFPFGSTREAMTRRQAFVIPKDMRLSGVTVTVPFQDVTDQDGRPLLGSHVRAVVQPSGPGRVVTVALCLNPDHPSEMRAGTYTGTALVGVSDRVTPVTLEATVQDDRWMLVVLFALAGVVAGLFMRLFADQQSTEHIRRFREVSRPRVIATAGAGLVVAYYSYRTIYLDDPTFYAGAGDLWRVTAETFAGTLAAKTLTDLAGQQRKKNHVDTSGTVTA